MRYSLPPLEIPEGVGFSSDLDIFERKKFGDRLGNIFSKSEDGLAVALQGEWGEGKTTFIKMWRGHVENRGEGKLRTIYFDAFKNDYQDNAFLAVVREIYAALPDTDDKGALLDKAKKVGIALLKGTAKMSVRVATAGILDGAELEKAGEAAVKYAGGEIEALVGQRIKSVNDDKKIFNDFYGELSRVVNVASQDESSEMKNPKIDPYVFVIDELDRCRPDFALDLLETIKHFFDIPGLSFLLVVNRRQLEAMVRCRYGNDMAADLYLNKFVNLFIRMPKDDGQRINYDSKRFYAHCCNKMRPQGANWSVVDSLLRELVHHDRISFREIERLVAVRNLAESAGLISQYDMNFDHRLALVLFYIWCSIIKPGLLESFRGGKISGAKLIEESNLVDYSQLPPDQSNHADEIWCMLHIVQYDISDDQERSIMKSQIDTAVSEKLATSAQIKYFQMPSRGRNQLAYIISVMANLHE